MQPPQDPWTSQAQPTASNSKVAKDTDTVGKPQQWMQAWAREVLLEQRRARRGRLWGGILRGLLTLAVVALIFGSGRFLLAPTAEVAANEPHLAVVDVKGTIMAQSQASAEQVLKGVKRAFAAEQAKALVLRINSPGGSPVQAGQIYDGILQLKQTRPSLPVYAVIEDLGASGGYYVAVAADTLVADRASLVGSIGVFSGGFGFKEALERLGIERRLFTSGDNKAFLDPFSDLSPQQLEFWQEVLASTHQQFIQRVKEGRGQRLAANPEIFSGLVWNGELALELGLIDELGSVFTLQEQLGLKASVNYTPAPNPWQLLEKRLATAIKTVFLELTASNF